MQARHQAIPDTLTRGTLHPLPAGTSIGVLLLHGFTSSLSAVSGFVPFLTDRGIDYEMPVLRGHTPCPKPSSASAPATGTTMHTPPSKNSLNASTASSSSGSRWAASRRCNSAQNATPAPQKSQPPSLGLQPWLSSIHSPNWRFLCRISSNSGMAKIHSAIQNAEENAKIIQNFRRNHLSSSYTMLKRRPRCSTTSKFLCASSTPCATKSSHTSVRSGYSTTSQAPTSNCIRSMRRGTNSGKIAKPIAFSKSPSTSSNGSSTKRALIAKHRPFRDEPPCNAIRVLKPCI